MNEELLNTPLYKRLCEATNKWFHKNRGPEQKVGLMDYANGKAFYFSKSIIEGKERNAEFTVNIFTEEYDGKYYRYVLSLSIYFLDDVVGNILNFDLKEGVWREVNRYNCKKPKRNVAYEFYDRIFIRQQVYFFSGCMPHEEEISKIINEFYFDHDNEEIADLIETKNWNSPVWYIERYSH